MPNKKTKLGKGRLDKFYYLAKEQGYRSRAAFKLIQLNRKYDFLSKCKTVVDLCAAPGGWAQVAAKYMPVQSMIIAIDLVPIRPIRNVIGIQADITTQKCRTEIKKHLKTWKVDAVLHDGAPNVGGSWDQDAYSQVELVLHSMRLATEFLRPGGQFVTKVFRSKDYYSLIWVMKQLFSKVEATKPSSSRNTSAEIFVYCDGFLAPKKIDPKMLDPKYVFSEIDEDKKDESVFAAKAGTKKRKAEGYEEGKSLLHTKVSVMEFIHSDEPIQMLGQVNQMVFEGDAKALLEHPKTDDEITTCLTDLKVLGKKEFKNILKWRLVMRQHLAAQLKAEREAQGIVSDDEDGAKMKKRGGSEDEGSTDEEERVDEELAGMEKELRMKKKRALRRKREAHAKFQRRVDMKMIQLGDTFDQEDLDLFNLKKVPKERDLTNAAPDIVVSDSDGDSSHDMGSNNLRGTVGSLGGGEAESDLDSDEEREARIASLNEEMEGRYVEYLELAKNRKKKIKIGKKEKLLQDDGDIDLAGGDLKRGLPGYTPNLSQDPLAARVDEDDDLTLKPLKASRTERWFSQDVFSGIGDEEEDEEQEEANGSKMRGVTRPNTDVEESSEAPAAKKQKRKKDFEDETDSDDDDENGGFEEVPAVDYYSSDDGESASDYDSEERAEALAIGAEMLSSKKRSAMIDDSYNRYAFNDDALPAWFRDDENKHNKPQKPVDKDMVAHIKARWKEINVRPMKKVAEAAARKKHRLAKKMERVKASANKIVDQEDTSEKAKQRQLEKLYRSKLREKKKETAYVVSRAFQKGRANTSGVKKGTKVKVVDKRMKNDKRMERIAAKRKKKHRK